MPSLGRSSPGKGGHSSWHGSCPGCQHRAGTAGLEFGPKGSGCVLGKSCYLSSLRGNLGRNLARLLTGDLQPVLTVDGARTVNKKGQEEVVGAILMALCYRISIFHTKVPVTSLGIRLLVLGPPLAVVARPKRQH